MWKKLIGDCLAGMCAAKSNSDLKKKKMWHSPTKIVHKDVQRADTHCTMVWARSCRPGERRRGMSVGPDSIRKHCRYIPHSWVFIFLHHGIRLEQKHERSHSKDRPTALLWRILANRGRQQTYSLLKPGPPLAKARFLNSVQTFCNCADWRDNDRTGCRFYLPRSKN